VLKQSLVKDKSYRFARRLYVWRMGSVNNGEFELARQVAKMGIASKEARETHYWLRLFRDSKTVTSERIDSLIAEAEELLRILTAIVKTCKIGTPEL
jgi:hypothetical protein